ncbi:MAG: hypothetical protein R3258_04770 [Acidimicrobiia bacterium]|nr:hypothetical protein [Acidimicrobiia bacterium]
MSPGLASRIEDIPGVAGVTVDLTESGGGINVRLAPGADESAVMEKVRGLLAAYGTKPSPEVGARVVPTKALREPVGPGEPVGLGVDLRITPIEGGARVEVATPNIRSFRIVPANPTAIAQGVADAWSQVTGRVPVEISSVTLDDDGLLEVVAGEGAVQSRGSANVSLGWEQALARAVGEAIGAIGQERSLAR